MKRQIFAENGGLVLRNNEEGGCPFAMKSCKSSIVVETKTTPKREPETE
jgi:hypothetical protein